MPGVFGTLLVLRNLTQRTNLCAMGSARKRSGPWDFTDGPQDHELLCNPFIGGVATQSRKEYSRLLRVGTTRLMFAVFILLGLMFGTSLGYLGLAALRAARSTTKDETLAVVATNAPNPSLGNGWEYAFYATREYSSKEPPKVPV